VVGKDKAELEAQVVSEVKVESELSTQVFLANIEMVELLVLLE
jgi:hypothetical protein